MAALGRTEIVLGYGAIPAANIKEGLRRLLGCFHPTRPGSVSAA
jgi:hypothetical protein